VKHARRSPINSRIQSEDLRDKHHTILHDQLIAEGKITEAQAIQQRKNKERRRRCWRTLPIIRKGSRATGGITHVLKRLATNPTILERIHEQHILNPALLDRNIEHFAQADGTPFTTETLVDLIGNDGCSQQALQILHGNIPTLLPKYPRLLLSKLRKTRNTIPRYVLERHVQRF
jgi:hypothetical protein